MEWARGLAWHDDDLGATLPAMLEASTVESLARGDDRTSASGPTSDATTEVSRWAPSAQRATRSVGSPDPTSPSSGRFSIQLVIQVQPPTTTTIRNATGKTCDVQSGRGGAPFNAVGVAPGAKVVKRDEVAKVGIPDLIAAMPVVGRAVTADLGPLDAGTSAELAATAALVLVAATTADELACADEDEAGARRTISWCFSKTGPWARIARGSASATSAVEGCMVTVKKGNHWQGMGPSRGRCSRGWGLGNECTETSPRPQAIPRKS